MSAIQRLGGYLAPRSVPQTTPVGPEAAAATIDVEWLRGVATRIPFRWEMSFATVDLRMAGKHPLLIRPALVL